jgi:diguanylate cyclase (GGDEF)-like protein
MSSAVRRARLLAGAACGTAVLAMVPWVGWWPVAIFALAPGPLLALDHALARARRPERVVAASLMLHTTLIVLGVAVSGGIKSPLLPWVAIPVLTAGARFRPEVSMAGAVAATAALVAAAVAGSSAGALNDPSPLIAVVAVLMALAVAQQPLLNAELRWRRHAVLDPLTGLLNRQGLRLRFEEVAEQARVTRRAVSLLVCDLDAFKSVNDAYGHARGDGVLREVADHLRSELRSFELLYRIGGEELLLILPGADLARACRVAEHVRAAVFGARPTGLSVTTSVGVCSASGEDIAFAPMFQAADRALYEAKRQGRNRVAFVPVLGGDPSLFTMPVLSKAAS